jgi:hypothetical protein
MKKTVFSFLEMNPALLVQIVKLFEHEFKLFELKNLR